MSAKLPQSAIEQIIGSLQMPDGCYVQLHTGPPETEFGSPGWSRIGAVDWGDVSWTTTVTVPDEDIPQPDDVLGRIGSALEDWERGAMRWRPQAQP
jgi:hypothetical protein